LHEQAQLLMPGEQLAILHMQELGTGHTYTARITLPFDALVSGLLIVDDADFVVDEIKIGRENLLAVPAVPADLFGVRAVLCGGPPPFSHVLNEHLTFELSVRNVGKARASTVELWGTPLRDREMDRTLESERR
jgi:hypothetical protein